MTQRITATEAADQAALFRWAAYQRGKYPELRMLMAVPNGGSRHLAEATNLKRQGVRAGFPDMLLLVPRGGYHGLAIELKRQRGGTVSPEQTEWLVALTEQGYKATVCRGFDEAVRTIMGYLEG